MVPALMASLIVISKGNESTVVSSVSDDPTRYNYVETCKAIHDHEHLFESFRRIPGYIEIVEPTDLSIAEKTIRYMLKNHSWVIKNPGVFQKMAQIDRVGNPYLHKISVDAAEPFSISTVALRYGMYAGKVSSYLMDVAKAKNREIESVVEIGGGFGGFGIVATDFFEFTSYTIVDIPEAVKVQKKFVSEFPLLSPVFKFVDGKSIEDPPSGEQYDLCVSTNAFSELTLEFRELYFRPVQAGCRGGSHRPSKQKGMGTEASCAVLRNAFACAKDSRLGAGAGTTASSSKR